MGQYWLLVDLDKHEFVHPHKLGVGLKLWEQAASGYGTGTAMLVLCAAMPEHRGDLDNSHPVSKATIGRWAGDRVTLIGDYSEDTDLAPEHKASEIWGKCQEGENHEPPEWLDISEDVAHVVEQLTESTFWGDGWRDLIENGKKPTKTAVGGKKIEPSLPPMSERVPTFKGASQPQAPKPSTAETEAEAIAEEMVSSSEDKP